MVRPAENSEKETLKNFPQENYWNPDEKERESDVCLQFKLQSKTEKKKSKKN
jgi:hypothetical protein